MAINWRAGLAVGAIFLLLLIWWRNEALSHEDPAELQALENRLQYLEGFHPQQPPPNQPPVANAGPDQTVTDQDGNGEESVALDGTGSTDPDAGDVLTYSWAEGGIEIATGVTPTVLFSVGAHAVELTVTDQAGAMSTDIVAITVDPAPPPPPPPPTGSLADCVATMTPGEWTNCGMDTNPAVGSRLADVLHPTSDLINVYGIRSNAANSSSVITAWCDASWDEASARMWFACGGHNAHDGNDVYMLDALNLTFSRVLDTGSPRLPDGAGGWMLCQFNGQTYNARYYPCDFNPGVEIPIGTPLPLGVGPWPPHTYAGQSEYVPGLNQWFRCGGFSPTPPAAQIPDPRVPSVTANTNMLNAFNVTTRQWTYWGAVHQNYCTGGSTRLTYDAVSDLLVIQGEWSIGTVDPAGIGNPVAITNIGGSPSKAREGSAAIGGRYYLTGAWLSTTTTTRFWLWPIIDNADGSIGLGTRIDLNLINDPNLMDSRPGIAWHPGRELFVMWGGKRDIFTLDPVTLAYEQYANPTGPAPSTARVFGKFGYYAPLDVFVAMESVSSGAWFYKLPASPTPPPGSALLGPPHNFTCVDGVVGSTCGDLQAMVDATPAGGTLALPRGKYRQCAFVNQPMTIAGDGSIIDGIVCGGKGAFVANADLVLSDVTCSGHGDHTSNLACVRRQADNITLSGVHCMDGDTCLVGGSPQSGGALSGSILVENSLIERMGGALGRSHGIYVHNADWLIVRDSIFRCMVGEGHHIKSGAMNTLIDNVTLDGADCFDSRLIDVYVAGGQTLEVRNSTLIESTIDDQADMIGLWPRNQGAHLQEVRITGNTFDCGVDGRALRNWERVAALTWTGNTLTGTCSNVPQ